MNSLFARLTLADLRRDVARNIVSLRESQDLFDDLTDNPAEWSLAQQVEDAVKPPPYRSRTPVIDRPFEDSAWFNAIDWPFRHWQASRFSDGSHGALLVLRGRYDECSDALRKKQRLEESKRRGSGGQGSVRAG